MVGLSEGQLAVASEEGLGSKGAVVPMTMIGYYKDCTKRKNVQKINTKSSKVKVKLKFTL